MLDIDTNEEVLNALQQLTRIFLDVAIKELESAVALAANVDVQGRLNDILPTGATGRLRQGLDSKVLRRGALEDFVIDGSTFSDATYTRNVEDGRAPGRMPPVDQLEQWATQRGLNPWAVALSIKRQGTQRWRSGEKGEWARTEDQIEDLTIARWETAAENIASKVEFQLSQGL